MARIVNASNFIDERGSLSVVEDDMLGFTPKRVFNLYNLNVNADRGNHGHKQSIVAMCCISGSCEVYVNDGRKISTYKLDKPTQFLVLEAHEWHKMYDFAENTIIQVLSSKNYDPDEYVFEEPKIELPKG